MQERKFEELEDRAVDHSLKDLTAQQESRVRVIKEIEAMKAEGKALELSEEEENMLRSFRRFKLRMRKRVETFTWQTRIGDEVVLAKESGHVVHPNEVGS
jgi:predicted sulfurtransferase